MTSLPSHTKPLQGNVEQATPGLQGFDTATPLCLAEARTLRQDGFRFCVRYLSRTTPQAPSDLSLAEAKAILAGGLALMAVQHVLRAGWIPSARRGAQYGAAATANARQVGLPAGVTLWLDLEGVRKNVDGEEVIAYCNNWFERVAVGGYEPGLYVGAASGLDGDQLYWRLKTRHYWRSGSRVPDLPHRGYQLVQRITSAPDKVIGIEIDRDVTYSDAFGGTASWLVA